MTTNERMLNAFTEIHGARETRALGSGCQLPLASAAGTQCVGKGRYAPALGVSFLSFDHDHNVPSVVNTVRFSSLASTRCAPLSHLQVNNLFCPCPTSSQASWDPVGSPAFFNHFVLILAHSVLVTPATGLRCHTAPWDPSMLYCESSSVLLQQSLN